MGEIVGLSRGEGVGGEAKGATYRAGAAVARSEDVDVGVADHEGLSGGDDFAGDGAGFRDEGEEAVWVWFFGMEAVAAVVLEEETVEAEVGADIA